MLKGELESLIGKEVTYDEFTVINKVYMEYPNILEKTQIADIYKAGGLRVIRDMEKRVDVVLELNKKIAEKEKLVKSLQGEIKSLKWELEQY